MIIDATKIWYFQNPPRSSYDFYSPKTFQMSQAQALKLKITEKLFSDKNKKSKKRK